MALQPQITVVWTANNFEITDTTVYGPPELNLNQVTVELRMSNMAPLNSTGSQVATTGELNAPATPPTLNGVVNVEGYYLATIHITPNDGSEAPPIGSFGFYLDQNNTEALELAALVKWADSNCNCESGVGIDNWLKIRMLRQVIAGTKDTEPLTAQKALNTLNKLNETCIEC